MPQPGVWIAQQYRVEKLIGKGGMAEVYKVWDQQRSSYLALKLLHPEYANSPALLELFKEEARTLESLRHPQIVRFYDLVHSDDGVCLLMDFVEGKTLREEIRAKNGPLPFDYIHEILGPVCSALQYAHSQGIAHCDLKPENILIDQSGKILLSDFGIAQMIQSGARSSTAYSRLTGGTPQYMAPEHILGLAATPQTDIYALGIILYEMVTGVQPFCGDWAPKALRANTRRERIRWEQQNVTPPMPSQLQSRSLAAIDEVVLRCLNKEPAQRYPKVIDVYNAFEHATEEGAANRPAKTERTSAVSPPPFPARAAQSRSRSTAIRWFAVLIVFALLFGFIWLILSRENTGRITPITGSVSTSARKISQETRYEYAGVCMAIPVQGDPQTELHECVRSITVLPDGKLKVQVEWTVVSSSNQAAVKVRADTNNTNMYLADDAGRRLDHIETGAGANQDLVLYNGQSKYGWFLFPAPAVDAKQFKFRDDDNQGATPLFDRLWP